MATDVLTRIPLMMQLRLMMCATITTTLLTRDVSGGDSVVVELKSGRRIRAHSIAQDVSHPDRVTLMIGTAQIHMERKIPWDRVDRMSAPADQRAELRIPDNVKVVESFEERPTLSPVPRLPSTPKLVARPGDGKRRDYPTLYDPGIVVGVRDFSFSPAPSDLRPDCCRFSVEP